MSAQRQTGFAIIAGLILLLYYLLRSTKAMGTPVVSSTVKPAIPGGGPSYTIWNFATQGPPPNEDVIEALPPGPTYPFPSCPDGYDLYFDSGMVQGQWQCVKPKDAILTPLKPFTPTPKNFLGLPCCPGVEMAREPGAPPPPPCRPCGFA